MVCHFTMPNKCKKFEKYPCKGVLINLLPSWKHVHTYTHAHNSDVISPSQQVAQWDNNDHNVTGGHTGLSSMKRQNKLWYKIKEHKLHKHSFVISSILQGSEWLKMFKTYRRRSFLHKTVPLMYIVRKKR